TDPLPVVHKRHAQRHRWINRWINHKYVSRRTEQYYANDKKPNFPSPTRPDSAGQLRIGLYQVLSPDLRYAIRFASSSSVMVCSNPSGINERPVFVSETILERRMDSSVPKAVLIVRLFSVSEMTRPDSDWPSAS